MVKLSSTVCTLRYNYGCLGRENTTGNESDRSLPFISNYSAKCRYIEFSSNAEQFEISDISRDKTSK